MTNGAQLTLFLPDDAATNHLARQFAHHAYPGMVLLLEGGIGAGKTHFARAFIRERLGAEIDVPSPTYTLVQTYEDNAGDIWHADLYRLGHPDEVAELGLVSAFETAICLIEWPDRLGNQIPPVQSASPCTPKPKAAMPYWISGRMMNCARKSGRQAHDR